MEECALMKLVFDMEYEWLMEDMREEEELEYQSEDANAVAQYDAYWAGIAADEYGKQFKQYDEGLEQQDWREKDEYEMQMECMEDAMQLQQMWEQEEEEAWYASQEAKWYAEHPEDAPPEMRKGFYQHFEY